MQKVKGDVTLTITNPAMWLFGPSKKVKDKRKSMSRAIFGGSMIIIPNIGNLGSKFGGKNHDFTHNTHGIPNERHVWFEFLRFEDKDKNKIWFSGASLNFPSGINSGSS